MTTFYLSVYALSLVWMIGGAVLYALATQPLNKKDRIYLSLILLILVLIQIPFLEVIIK